MSTNDRDLDDGVHKGVSQLLVRAAAADSRADARLAVAIDDFFLPDEARLDDRLRGLIAATLGSLVAAVEGALRQHAVRLLVQRDEPEAAAALERTGLPVLDRLVAAGLVRDADLMRELIARVRQDLMADHLPSEAPADSDTPSLLSRLATHADSVVAAGAMALLAAEARRRAMQDNGPTHQTDLPADLHHRLVWWVAAALREHFNDTGAASAAIDRSLAEAAMRSLAAHDESDRLEAAAMRLAIAFDASPRELPPLLVEALGDRRIALFIALLAHALGVDFAQARAVVLDPVADRLWLVLRALELDRADIARIALALSEADPRRDIEAFADALDCIAATPTETARRALSTLKLHPDYRAALLALSKARAA